MQTFDFHGVQIMNYEYSFLRGEILSSHSKTSKNVIFASGSTLVRAIKDHEHFKVLQSSIVICDSKVVWRAIKLWNKDFQYCRGVDFFRNMLADNGNTADNLIYGGAKFGTEEISYRLERIKAPSVRLSHRTLPYSEDIGYLSEIILSTLKTEPPYIIWLCLGSPKQDFVSLKLLNGLEGACVSIGAALNFVTGAEKEAPTIWRSLYLEWAYRLMHNPKRLWRRYLIENLELMRLIFLLVIRKNKSIYQ